MNSYFVSSFPDANLNGNAHDHVSGYSASQSSYSAHSALSPFPSHFLAQPGQQYGGEDYSVPLPTNGYDASRLAFFPREFEPEDPYHLGATLPSIPADNYPRYDSYTDAWYPQPQLCVNPQLLNNPPAESYPPAPAHFPDASPAPASALLSPSWVPSGNSHTECDTDGETDSSGSYVPSPAPSPTPLPISSKRGRYSPYNTPPSSQSSTSTSARSSRVSPPPLPTGPRSRNIQTERPMEEVLAISARTFSCAVCGHVQKNRRFGDLQRHVKSHYRKELEVWLCGGVAVDEAAARRMVNAHCVDGQWFAGGCMIDFSRSDALKRHAKNRKLTCCSTMDAPYNTNGKRSA